MKRIWVHLLKMGLVLFLASGMTGCGKKGPPLPPLAEGRVAVVSELISQPLDQGGIHLTWAYPKGEGILPAETFELSQAERDESQCQGCPLTFKVIHTLEGTETAKELVPNPQTDSYYRIQAIGPDNLKGPFSNPIKIEKKQQ